MPYLCVRIAFQEYRRTLFVFNLMDERVALVKIIPPICAFVFVTLHVLCNAGKDRSCCVFVPGWLWK